MTRRLLKFFTGIELSFILCAIGMFLLVTLTGCTTVDLSEWKAVSVKDCLEHDICIAERTIEIEKEPHITVWYSWECPPCETYYEFIKK